MNASVLLLVMDKNGAEGSAARSVGYLSPILQWAKRRDLVVGEFNLGKPLKNDPERRVLPEVELSALLPIFKNHPGVCAKFMLLTGARITEVTAATWSQLDLEAKTSPIPPENIKYTRAPSPRRKRQRINP